MRRRGLIIVEDLPVPFDRRVWTEAKTLRDAGWRMTVISPKGEGADRWHERLDGIEVFRYPLPTTAAGFVSHLAEYAVAIPATLILALLAWRGRRFDVVHACNPPDFFFPVGWLFKRLGSAFVFDQHDLSPEVYVAQGGRRGGLVHRVLLRVRAAHVRTADVVIATNETYRRFAVGRGGVDPERVFVVRSSPDPPASTPSRPIPRSVTAGRISWRTSGRWGRRTASICSSRPPACRRGTPGHVRFVAMGGGPMLDALREQARRQGLSDDVTSPAVCRTTVRRVLSTADVAISPDPANDFNEYCTMNKTLEYMAVGRPGRRLRPRGDPRFCGRCGRLRPAQRSRRPGRARDELMDDPERRARMGEIGGSACRGRSAGPQREEPDRGVRGRG